MSTHCTRLRICAAEITRTGSCHHEHVAEPPYVLVERVETEIAEWLRGMPGDHAQIEALADGVLERRYRERDNVLKTTRVVTMTCGICVFHRERNMGLYGSADVVCQQCAGTGKVRVAMPGATTFDDSVPPSGKVPPPRRMSCGCDEGKHPLGKNYLAGAADRDGFTCSNGWPR